VNKIRCLTFIILYLSGGFIFSLSAQEQQKTFKQDDVFSIFVKKSKRAARDSADAKPVILYKPYFSVTPYIGYNPA